MSQLEGDCAFANSSRMHPDHGQAITNATKPGSVAIVVSCPHMNCPRTRSTWVALATTFGRIEAGPDEPSASDDLPKHWRPRSHDHERDQPDQYATEQSNPVWNG
jgi:hypothetical protein